MNEYRQAISNSCYCLALIVLGAVACSAQPLSPLPKLVPAKSVTGVTLKWDTGHPWGTTISNLTTRQFIYVGFLAADAVMFTGLPIGSTNRFLAFNPAGSTDAINAVSTVQDLRSTIVVHSYLVTVNVKSNYPATLLTSTNLTHWRQLAVIFPTNTTYSFIWTNDGIPNRYFRATAP